MKIGEVITAAGFEVEKLTANAWTARSDWTGLVCVSTWPDGKFVGIPEAVHAVKVAEQMADEVELQGAK